MPPDHDDEPPGHDVLPGHSKSLDHNLPDHDDEPLVHDVPPSHDLSLGHDKSPGHGAAGLRRVMTCRPITTCRAWRRRGG